MINEKYSLALDYHENTKLIKGTTSYNPRIPYKVYPNTKTISLEKNDYNNETHEGDLFVKTLLKRKSTRSFSEENISVNELSRLLTLSCGLKNDTKDSFYRTYASAGGRYPIEVYVIVLRSSEMDKGIYHYNVFDNTLELVKVGECANEIKSFYTNMDEVIVTDYPCLILFSMVYRRTMDKYGDRGYRFILLDAGHMSQNLYLVATYLNLGIVAFGAGEQSDNTLDDMLGLHGNENAFYAFALGHPQLESM